MVCRTPFRLINDASQTGMASAAFTSIRGGEAHGLPPPGDVSVKGDPKVPALLRKPGAAVAAQVHGGPERSVKAAEVVDLAADLAVPGDGRPLGHAGFRIFSRQGNAPLVHDGLVLFLQLQEHRGLRGGGAVAAQAQFLFIYRLFQAGPDQAEVRGVVIHAADGALPVWVRAHGVGEGLLQGGALLVADQVFQLVTPEDKFAHFTSLPCLCALSIAGEA